MFQLKQFWNRARRGVFFVLLLLLFVHAHHHNQLIIIQHLGHMHKIIPTLLLAPDTRKSKDDAFIAKTIAFSNALLILPNAENIEVYAVMNDLKLTIFEEGIGHFVFHPFRDSDNRHICN